MKSLTKESIDNYVHLGIPPGDFIKAVLANDLMEALGRADEENRFDIFEICQYVFNEIPAKCHGSYEIVDKWLEAKYEERASNANEGAE